MKKVIQFVLAALLALNFTVVLASEPLIYVDFSPAPGNTPTGYDGFDSWFIGGVGGKNPTIAPAYGYDGKDINDVSSVLTSGEGVSIAKAPYVKKALDLNVAQGQKINVNFKLATDDYNSLKLVYFKINGNLATEPANAVYLDKGDAATAKMIIFGQEAMIGYQTGKWYDMDFVFTGGENTFEFYIGGKKLAGGTFAGSPLTSLDQIYYGLSSKTAAGDTANIYFDDFLVREGGIDTGKIIDISSEAYTIDAVGGIIKDLPEGMTAGEFKAAMNTPNGEIIRLFSPDRTEITEDSAEVYSGVIVQAWSANGASSVEYTVVNLKITLTEPAQDLYLRPGANVTLRAQTPASQATARVDFTLEGSGGAQTVTALAAPYEATFQGLAVGIYSVYATAFDAFGNSVKSQARNVLVQENVAPEVSFKTLASGNVQYAEELTDAIVARDTDGTLKSLELFVDGKRYERFDVSGGKTEFPFVLKDINIGEMKLTAVAYDDSGARAEATADILVSSFKESVVYDNDFSSSTPDFSTANAIGTEGVQEVYYYDASGNKLMTGERAWGIILGNVPSNGAPYFVTSVFNNALQNGETVIQYEVMIARGGPNFSGFTMRNNVGTGIFYTPAKGSLEAGKWHQVKHVLNLAQKTCTTYWDGSLLETATNIATDGTVQNIRFTISNPSGNESAVFFKNMYAASQVSGAYINGIEAQASGEDSKLDAKLVRADTDTLQLNISQNLVYSSINRNNVLVYANGKQVGGYDVSIGLMGEQDFTKLDGNTDKDKTANAVSIKFKEPLQSMASYRVVLTKDVVQAAGTAKLVANTVYDFKVSNKAFDVTAWSVEAGGKQIQAPEDINAGDSVTLSADFVNGEGPKQGVLILAVFSGNEMIGCSVQDITAAGGETLTSGPVSISKNSDLKILGFVWDSMDGMNNLATPFIMQ